MMPAVALAEGEGHGGAPAGEAPGEVGQAGSALPDGDGPDNEGGSSDDVAGGDAERPEDGDGEGSGDHEDAVDEGSDGSDTTGSLPGEEGEEDSEKDDDLTPDQGSSCRIRVSTLRLRTCRPFRSAKRGGTPGVADGRHPSGRRPLPCAQRLFRHAVLRGITVRRTNLYAEPSTEADAVDYFWPGILRSGGFRGGCGRRMADRLVRGSPIQRKSGGRFPRRRSRLVEPLRHHARPHELLRVSQRICPGEGLLLGRHSLWRILRLGRRRQVACVFVRGAALFHRGIGRGAQRCVRHGGAPWLRDVRRRAVQSP